MGCKLTHAYTLTHPYHVVHDVSPVEAVVLEVKLDGDDIPEVPDGVRLELRLAASQGDAAYPLSLSHH